MFILRQVVVSLAFGSPSFCGLYLMCMRFSFQILTRASKEECPCMPPCKFCALQALISNTGDTPSSSLLHNIDRRSTFNDARYVSFDGWQCKYCLRTEACVYQGPWRLRPFQSLVMFSVRSTRLRRAQYPVTLQPSKRQAR